LRNIAAIEVCETSEHKPDTLFIFGPTMQVYSEVDKLRVYVGKTEDHRGQTSLITSTFSRLA